MKKFISLILAVFIAAGLFAGCGTAADEEKKPVGTKTEEMADKHEEKLKIVATIFPVYDWLREIIGKDNSNAELELLIDNGVDLHSYQPTSEDILAISNADIFVYVGGHSDDWVEEVLKNAENDDMVVINLFEVLGDTLKPLALVEGMESNHHHDHDHDEHDHDHDEHDHDHDEHDHDHDEHGHDHDEHDHDHDEHGHDHNEHDHDHDEHGHDHDEHGHDHNEHGHDHDEHGHDHDEHGHDHDEHDHDHDAQSCDSHKHGHDDEHVWLSLPRAVQAVKYITDEVIKLDPDNSSLYSDNAQAYITKLEELNEAYISTIKESRLKTVLFADRFPFFYLADDYNLNYFAAFTGCSAESEASFETVAFLAKKLDELDIHSVITIENRSHKIPETVIENTKDKDMQILVLNSLQSVTSKDIAAGITYYDVMKSNLDILAEALK